MSGRSDLYGRLQWLAYRLAIVNDHTDRTQIFYSTCEMKTVNWMQSIVMRISRDLYQKLMNTN